MNRRHPIAMPWAVVFGFVRLMTHPSVLVEPAPPLEALARIEGWLERDHVHPIDPGPQHLRVCRELFQATGVAGNLTTDTHLAALAIEHACELHSNDSDFRRFPRLRWHNPLV